MVDDNTRDMVPELLREIRGKLDGLTTQVSALDSKVSALDSKVSAIDSKLEATREDVQEMRRHVTIHGLALAGVGVKLDELRQVFGGSVSEVRSEVHQLELRVSELEARP